MTIDEKLQQLGRGWSIWHAAMGCGHMCVQIIDAKTDKRRKK